jgi:hypothetical protein
MNGKKTTLTANAFGNNQILTNNQHYSNGVLFTIQGKAQYFPTVFEYLRKDADLDSIASFFYNYRFYRKEFVPERSVAGGLENGKTVYLDSVFVQQNDLWDYLWAYTNEEDSTYWQVVPTNQVWKQLIEEYEPYFNYDKNVPFRDSMAYTLPNWDKARSAASLASQMKNREKTYGWQFKAPISPAVEGTMKRTVTITRTA